MKTLGNIVVGVLVALVGMFVFVSSGGGLLPVGGPREKATIRQNSTVTVGQAIISPGDPATMRAGDMMHAGGYVGHRIYVIGNVAVVMPK